MCGIFGVWSERDSLAALGAALAHRGPDDQGRFDDGRIHLGNRRLSILDLGEHGRQPMASDDGTLVLTFNGEIYNHCELRRRLEARGHRFRSRTDSEVLLGCFREWGGDAVRELSGMFALALWMAREEELLLVRDPTGVKPLFYAELDDGSFAFASEMRALLELPGIRREIDAESLWQYLEFGYIWTEDRTALRQVRKVPPGHAIRVRNGRVRSCEAWYRPPAPELTIETREQLDHAADGLLRVLVEVLEQQVKADVPVGLLLSGGLDSSILAAICAQVLKVDIPAFTVGFEGGSPEDLRSSRAVAQHLGLVHRELVIDPPAIVRELQANAACYDDLFWDPGLLTSLALFRCCRAAGAVVAIVGEGADELFGGYSSFARLGCREQDDLPVLVSCYRFFRHYTGRPTGRSLEQALMRIREIHERNGSIWYRTIRDFELHYQLPNNLNAKLDRSSMANGVEARVPYQDPRVSAVGLAIGGDPRSLMSDKGLLRHLARRHGLLPDPIVARAKLGLMMPREWVFADRRFHAFAEQTMLHEGRWARRLGLERQLVATLACPAGIGASEADVNTAWRVMILEHWSRSLGLADAPLV